MNRFKQHIENPLVSLGVGHVHLIKSWLDEMKIKNYVINDDLTIDVNGDVYLSFKNLNKFPSFIKFNKISGDLSCRNNNLTSLEWCPTSVGGDFTCHHNNLTSLEGCPTSIGGDFSCSNNQLTSLEGCPTLVRGNFFCYNNNLTSLEGCPTSVGGDFFCYNNNLTSLEGCPTSVGGDFSCFDNERKFTEDEVKKYCDVKRIIYNN